MTARHTDQLTDLFLELTPERVLEAVDSGGLPVRPVCYPLNSFENRVYEVELADRSRVVAKFYRPGRWSRSRILAEHQFLAELAAEEIPVVPARELPGGGTLGEIAGIYFALFDRRGGRAPDELRPGTARRLGQLAARLHVVGGRRPDADRARLSGAEYLLPELVHVERSEVVPERSRRRWLQAARGLAAEADRRLAGVPVLRLHGDLHLGNVLERDGELLLVDFDDCRIGPAVQDLWLALPGCDRESEALRGELLAGYATFRDFDPGELALVEALRGLRMAQYAAWVMRRWHDPVFPHTWPQFATPEHWERETEELERQLVLVERGGTPGAPRHVEGPTTEEPELGNADFFWDWEG